LRKPWLGGIINEKEGALMPGGFPTIFLLIMAAVVLLLAWPLRYDRVGPNPWYGVRFSQSFQSPEHWYLINRYGATMLIRWAFSLAALAVLLALPLGVNSEIQTAVALIYPLTVFVPVLITYRYARRLGREKGTEGPIGETRP
jgi:ABC-type phosphate transport system permease subunit